MVKEKSFEIDPLSPVQQAFGIVVGGWLLRVMFTEVVGWVFWLGGGLIWLVYHFVLGGREI